jgi:dolichol-phosphate mannosyltransferase
MKLSVVLPVYNNEEALHVLVPRLIQACKKASQRFELLFVNDGSQDGSLKILHEFADIDSCVKVINLSRNYGQHPAISAGLEHALGEVIILMDADLQDKPEDIHLLLQKMAIGGFDVIYTIRKYKGGQPSSRLTSALYHYIFSKVVGSNVPRDIGTFRAFNRKVLEALLKFPESNVLYGPLMFYIGFSNGFISLPFVERPYGESSYTFSKRFNLALNSLISYTDVPHRITTLAGFLLLLGTIAYGVVVAIQYLLIGRSLPSGITILILLICSLAGAVLFSLGVMGSYVFRIYQEVLRRPRYLVQTTRNLT